MNSLRGILLDKRPVFLLHQIILCLLLCLFTVTGFSQAREYAPDPYSPGAQVLIDQSFSDIKPGSLRDYHTHIFGLDEARHGTFVNENWQSILYPQGYIRFNAFKKAAGVTDLSKADSQVIDRLLLLIRKLPQHGKYGLMAFDYFHDEAGKPDKTLSTFHVPNQRVIELANQYPEYFFPIISIHPYRENAVDELLGYAQQGVRYVKWLPNAMGIHPDAKKNHLRQKLEAYYSVMAQYDMVLISHTGDEHAAEAKGLQSLGNPHYLYKPLSMGVKVVMAHVASLGECRENEPGICQKGEPYDEIAIRMLRDKQYDGRLFADISALTQFNRMESLDKVLAAADIHHKLINGSDYPLPAVNFVIMTRLLVWSDHITSQERKYLNEIYKVNPLLFDYVLKRTLRHPETGQRFAPSVFAENPQL